MRRRFIVAAIISTVVPVASLSAQLVFQVCKETCPDPFRDPGGAAMCQARISLCESKLTSYNSYMLQLSAGVPTYQLPAKYREILQPFYSGNLANWRFGFADRQPPGNATTDCNVTYFNRAGFVTLLRDGNLDGLWGWLFHELRHFSQCNQLGSRDAYSKMWFGHLELAFIQSNNLETLHDRMLMEADAETFAVTVLERTRTMRDIHGHLVKPFVVTLAGPSGALLADRTTISKGTYDVSGSVTGGHDPVERNWWVKRPGMTYFEQVPASVVNDGRGFHLNAPVTGEYTLRLHVRQPGSNLPEAMRQIVLVAVEPRTIFR
jgi:hypothetical protein